MNTAYDAFCAIIQDTRNSDVVYDYLDNIVKPPYDYSDLLRWQWAQSVSALDKLIHDLIRIGMVQTYQGLRTPTAKYRSFTIDMDCLAQMNQMPLLAVTIFEAQIVHKLTFQSYQEPIKISDGLSLIWDETNKWKRISVSMGLDENYLNIKLKNISIRRNQIVHEGDYSNALLQRQAITHTDTSDVVDFIFSLGTTIYNLVK